MPPAPAQGILAINSRMRLRAASVSIAPAVLPMQTRDPARTARSFSSPKSPPPASTGAIRFLANVTRRLSHWSRRLPACRAVPMTCPTARSKSRTLKSDMPGQKPTSQRRANQWQPSRERKEAAERADTKIQIRGESMTRTPGTYALFETSEGTIVCRLFEKEAPKTVANFVELAEGQREWTHPTTRKKTKDPLYHGTIFHRVIPNFMIQGGDPMGTGFGGPGYQFEDETKGSPHRFDKAGKLAMANSGPNTNGSQFFITVANTDWLTSKHTIFGEVVEGYEVVEAISKVAKNRQDRPNKDVVVKSVRIER